MTECCCRLDKSVGLLNWLFNCETGCAQLNENLGYENSDGNPHEDNMRRKKMSSMV